MLLQLQHTHGNSFVQRLVAGFLTQRQCTCGGNHDAGTGCADCGATRSALQPGQTAESEPSRAIAPPIVQEVLHATGQPLDEATRAFMERRFGFDFGEVRLHTDAPAAESARAIHALAYTVGNRIVWGSGQYQPDSDHGRSLLAHELTHVVQQNQSPAAVDTRLEVGPSDTPEEYAADRIADAISHSQPLQVTGEAVASSIQRRVPDEPDYTARGQVPGFRRPAGLELDSASDLAARLRQDSGSALTTLEVEAALNNEVYRVWNNHGTMLRLDYLETVIFNRTQFPKIGAAYDSTEQHIGLEDFAKQKTALAQEGPKFVAFVENDFITNPAMSSLDLLPSEQRSRYQGLKWDAADYPGGPAGPNEDKARQMAADLSAIRPERRVNQGDSAVVTEAQHNSTMRQYIQSQLQPLPDFPGPAPNGQTLKQPGGQRLNKHALEAFLRLREAALKDGVVIIVRDAYRTPEQAAHNAEKADNREAVAKFSPHMLGLAIDLQMGFTYETASGPAEKTYQEMTTQPMQNVVDMRQSPVHKWLFMKGAAYGWYPYQNEPWHWEYNLAGFHEVFREDQQAKK